MGHSYFNANLIGCFLQILFKYVMSARITSSSIGEDQNARRSGIKLFAVGLPPAGDTSTRKLARVMAGSKRDIAFIPFYVIYPMWNDDTISA